jgi:DNA-binding PadR family transcriptional regulator
MRRTGELTDNEGGLIALVQRKGPLSAYQMAKEYEASPIYTFNTAKGKLYPLIERLIDRGLLRSDQVLDDRRGTKLYSCTDAGREALRTWVATFREEHELPPDPLRRKLQAVALLGEEEQMAWIEEARTRLSQRLQAVEDYDTDADGPFGRLAQDNARASLRARLHWLDGVETSIRNMARPQDE